MSDTVISSVFLCPKCKYTNPNKSKFCMQCGNPLSDSVKQAKSGKLVLVEKGKDIKEFPLSEKTTIGKGAAISVEGADFSKSICELQVDGDKLVLKVLTEGVFVQVNTDKTLELENGAMLRIGDKFFRVSL